MSKQFKEGSDFEAAAKVLLGESTTEELNERRNQPRFRARQKLEIADYLVNGPRTTRYYNIIEFLKQQAEESSTSIQARNFVAEMLDRAEEAKEAEDTAKEVALELIDDYPEFFAELMKDTAYVKTIYK
jgi:hypothetical protein